MKQSPRILIFSERIYQRLLYLYPARHRSEYGPQMIQLFRDLSCQTYHQSQTVGMLALWRRLLPDLGASAGKEHLSDQKRDGMRKFCGRANVDPGVSFSMLAAALVIAFGILAKALIIGSGGTVWMATSAVMGANLTAAAIVEVFAHARGTAIIPTGMLITSALLPLLWVKDAEGWLRANPINAFVIIIIVAYWHVSGRERPRLPAYLVGALLAAAQMAISFLG